MKSASKIKGGIIFRGDKFQQNFHRYFSRPNPFSVSINERVNSPTDEVQSRTLNHWEKEGVLDDVRESGKGWRKYSALEIIWMNVVLELRGFNYSHAKIRKAKASLEEFSDKVNSSMPMLEVYIALALMNPSRVYLLVLQDGETLIGTEKEILTAKQFGGVGNHISIDLDAIINKVFPNKDIKRPSNFDWDLSESERKLLQAIRLSNAREIAVNFKNGEPDRIHVTELIQDKELFKRVADSFGSIKNNFRDGRHVSQEVVSIIKL